MTADGGDEAVHELLGGEIRHRNGFAADAAVFLQVPADGMHQMGLAQSDTAVKKQRIETVACRLFRDATRACVCHFVGFSDHECIECETRIERGGDLIAGIRFFFGFHTRFHDFDGELRGHLDDRMRGVTDDEIDTAHGGILGLPQCVHARTVMIAHPVAHEAGGQTDGDLIAVQPGEGHWPQPVSVFGFAYLGLQKAANLRPDACELRFFHVILAPL